MEKLSHNDHIDLYRHLAFCVIGGFFGGYAILVHSGIMGNAQTVNLIELLMDFLRADGHGVPELLDAILQVIPLDEYVEHPVMIMQVAEKDRGMEIPIWDEYKKIVAKYDARGEAAFGSYERFEFYDEARKTYCILQSGETAIYANVILQKGVIK